MYRYVNFYILRMFYVVMMRKHFSCKFLSSTNDETFFSSGFHLCFIFRSAQNAYYKALLSNAAICALRLHQRLGRVEFTKEFLAQLVLEDSCHYLFYSLIFMYVAPVTRILKIFEILVCMSYFYFSFIFAFFDVHIKHKIL